MLDADARRELAGRRGRLPRTARPARALALPAFAALGYFATWALCGLAAAWRHGWRLGLRCTACCANLTAIQLLLGIMDLRAMTLVTAAIAAERLAPAGERIARITGLLLIALGVWLSARAIASW